MTTINSADPGATQRLGITVLRNQVHVTIDDPRVGHASIHVSLAELKAALPIDGTVTMPAEMLFKIMGELGTLKPQP